MRVWDPFVRVFHWSLVLSFALAWFTSEWRESIHYWAGYAAASLVLLRVVWGFLGTPYSRFSQFIQTPKNVLRYLLAILSGSEARYVGHNPAGGIMILALMAAITMTAFSGWMMTTDAYFGEDRVQILHSLSADGVVGLVLMHLMGVVLASFRHRENLVKAMITGMKRSAEDGDDA
jgi:cytochrome b